MTNNECVCGVYAVYVFGALPFCIRMCCICKISDELRGESPSMAHSLPDWHAIKSMQVYHVCLNIRHEHTLKPVALILQSKIGNCSQTQRLGNMAYGSSCRHIVLIYAVTLYGIFKFGVDGIFDGKTVKNRKNQNWTLARLPPRSMLIFKSIMWSEKTWMFMSTQTQHSGIESPKYVA